MEMSPVPSNGPAAPDGWETSTHRHGEGPGRCRGWDGAGMRWSSEPREEEEEEEAVGSCYLIVQGYGEVPAGALHLVLGTLLL